MNESEAVRFTDIALYALNILAHSAKMTASRSRLHGFMPSFMTAHLQSAISRGWVTSRPAPPSSKDKTVRFTLTDAGRSHLRHLVKLSNQVPIPA